MRNKMIKDIFFAWNVFRTLRRSDAMYVVFKKSRDGSYDLYEDCTLTLDRKL